MDVDVDVDVERRSIFRTEMEGTTQLEMPEFNGPINGTKSIYRRLDARWEDRFANYSILISRIRRPIVAAKRLNPS